MGSGSCRSMALHVGLALLFRGWLLPFHLKGALGLPRPLPFPPRGVFSLSMSCVDCRTPGAWPENEAIWGTGGMTNGKRDRFLVLSSWTCHTCSCPASFLSGYVDRRLILSRGSGCLVSCASLQLVKARLRDGDSSLPTTVEPPAERTCVDPGHRVTAEAAQAAAKRALSREEEGCTEKVNQPRSCSA